MTRRKATGTRKASKTAKRKSDNGPHFLLKMKARDPDDPSVSTVGAGWENSAGGISIKLHPGTVLDWRDREDWMLTLWPND